MIDDVLRVLDGVKKTPNGWDAKCPAHDDRQASLALSVSERGNVLVKCFAGCSFSDVVAATKLPKAAFFADANGPRAQAARAKHEIDALYDYRDENRTLLYQVVRYKPDAAGNKKFVQRVPDPAQRDRWIWKLGDTRRVLFRLPELIAAPLDEPILVPEGEKDVLTLVERGFTATCNPMGAGKWRKDYTDVFRGRRVIVLPDNDKAGLDHAITVCESLAGVAAAVKLVKLPRVGPGGDVTDWFAAGGTIDQFREIVRDTPAYAPPEPATRESAGPAGPPEQTIATLADGYLTRLKPLWRRKTQSIYSDALSLEIPVTQLWCHVDDRELEGVAATAEGQEMIRNGKLNYRTRVATVRDAIRLAAGKILPTLPEHAKAQVNHLLDSEDLESLMTAWLFKDRTCRLQTGNPVSITYYGFASGAAVGEGWCACFNSGVFARRDDGEPQPQIAAQGDLLTQQLNYESNRTLARDARQAGLADPDSTIRCDGRVFRAWKLLPDFIARAAGTRETT